MEAAATTNTDAHPQAHRERTRKNWIIAPTDTDRAQFLARELRVHPIVSHLLLRRGVQTADEGVRFLNRKLTGLHDPKSLPGVEEAADRLAHAAKAGRSIVVYGDYDVDGMCASAVLLESLTLAGAKPTSYVPDRFEEGYGVNTSALESIKQAGADLVVTVDCGIASPNEAAFAREIGLEYIVTDHHEWKDELPTADAVVHPRLPGGSYPFPHLCGTAVAFKLAWELGRRLNGAETTSPAFRKFLIDATTLAAVGTICDVVPMEGENRILVHHGLLGLKSAPPLGLAHLLRVAKLDGKARLEADDVGFGIGPRLNASGRLGHARLGVELLTTRDHRRAEELAEFLDAQNKERQSIERRTFLEARALAESRYQLADGAMPAAMVLASDDWHPGVIGIVASRMVERYHRPCLLISFQESVGTGSGRSIPGLHLQQALAGCGEHLLGSGGHAMAAGLRLEKKNLEAFREAFETSMAEQTPEGELCPHLNIDLEVPLHALKHSLVKSLEVLEPFGVNNPKPLFLATGLTLAGEPKVMGGGDRHFSFHVRQGETTMRGVAFNLAERMSELADDQGRCSVVFEPFINQFRGYPEIELRVRDFRPGPTVASSP